MTKREKIRSIYKAEFELVKEQTGILLQQKKNGFNGELKESGYLVESFVKDLLRKYLPNGYRICSGYIATLDLFESDDNLIQHDVIIVDDRVPSLYKFAYGDVEIVPAEAVCGIFEVKRTLTRGTIKNAIDHLRTTAESLDKYQDACKSKIHSRNNVCGPTIGICTTAPVYGIIGLQHDKNVIEDDNDIDLAERDFLDIIWSISTPYLRYLIIRDTEGREFFAQNTSRQQQPYICAHAYHNIEKSDVDINFSRAITRIQTWINNTSMQKMDSDTLQRYFGLH